MNQLEQAVNFSKHANVRANQRGIRPASIEALLELADIATPVARGLTVMRISRRSLAFAASEGLGQSMLEQLKKLAVVQAEDGTLVTCARVHGSKSKAYLRRDRHKFWRA